jgi:DNA-binding response OmpR family regulator
MPAAVCIQPMTQIALFEAPISLLAVGIDDEDYRALCRILGECQFTLYRAQARHDALPLVRDRRPAVVICERELADGTWQDLLGDLQCEVYPPMLIVCSLIADDRLWAEVLNIGGYDVLMKPFHHIEVTRVVQMAARQSGRSAR